MLRDLLRSINLSIARNGLAATVNLLWHYTQLKKSKQSVYTFDFKPFGHPISLRPHTSDFSVFRQIAMNGEYDLPIPIKPLTIIDAGANIGLASLYFNARFPGASIFSLEPDPENYKALQNNVRSVPAIKTFAMALWGRKQQLSLRAAGADAWGIQVEASEEGQSDVTGIDLSSFMHEQGIETIDLLKIDIEGAEVELFQSDYELWLKKTRILIIELHENIRPGCEKIFFDAMKSINHRIEHSGENTVVHNLDLL